MSSDSTVTQFELQDPPVDVKAPRDAQLDFLRGMCLLVMTIDHLPVKALHRFTYEVVGYITAAEGFVLISGITCGLVYGRAASATRRILVRCGIVYVTYLLLSSLVWLTSRAGPWGTGSWHDLLLIARGTPGQLAGPAGVLFLYVVLLLMLPLVLQLVKAGYMHYLLVMSFGLWLLAQWRIGPQIGLGYILAWQFLFVAGVWLGYGGKDVIRLPVLLTRNGLMIGAAGCLIFFLFRHPFFHPPILDPSWAITSKEAVGLMRLLNVSLLVLLIASFPPVGFMKWTQPASFPAYGAVRFLGSHSLQVFGGHVLITQACMSYGALWARESWGRQALMAGTVITLLFIPAYTHQQYRRWSLRRKAT